MDSIILISKNQLTLDEVSEALNFLMKNFSFPYKIVEKGGSILK